MLVWQPTHWVSRGCLRTWRSCHKLGSWGETEIWSHPPREIPVRGVNHHQSIAARIPLASTPPRHRQLVCSPRRRRRQEAGSFVRVQTKARRRTAEPPPSLLSVRLPNMTRESQPCVRPHCLTQGWIQHITFCRLGLASNAPLFFLGALATVDRPKGHAARPTANSGGRQAGDPFLASLLPAIFCLFVFQRASSAGGCRLLLRCQPLPRPFTAHHWTPPRACLMSANPMQIPSPRRRTNLHQVATRSV